MEWEKTNSICVCLHALLFGLTCNNLMHNLTQTAEMYTTRKKFAVLLFFCMVQKERTTGENVWSITIIIIFWMLVCFPCLLAWNCRFLSLSCWNERCFILFFIYFIGMKQVLLETIINICITLETLINAKSLSNKVQRKIFNSKSASPCEFVCKWVCHTYAHTIKLIAWTRGYKICS